MDKKYSSVADLSNMIAFIEYYELQWWTGGGTHVQRFLSKEKALQCITELKKRYIEELHWGVEYDLVKCEVLETTTDLGWYNVLLENGDYGYTF